ncbi:MAG: hypothetical protein QOE45_314 [Frankiaceae bacterium]|nr:hypothetical protein [Frankiaceae bacterium]
MRSARRILVAALLACLAWSAVQLVRAALDGRSGAASLRTAETALAAGDAKTAQARLTRAERSFDRANAAVRGLGPAGYVLRATPFVRVQLRAVERFTRAGHDVAAGGREIATAIDGLGGSGGDPIAALREMQAAAGTADQVLASAEAQVAALRGYRLVWPLSAQQREVERRLPQARGRVAALKDGLNAMIRFAGGAGPRRYLVVSQNPDEVRPTGGFIGTYGVLAGTNGRLRLERYAPIESWYLPRPAAALPLAQSASALQFAVPRSQQSIANANTSPDWPTSAALARELWRRGGERPVDGVVSVTPDFLARVLKVVGPVKLPSYPDTVSADNVIRLADDYTHREPVARPGGRKGFVVELAQVALQRLVNAPRAQWPALGQAAGAGLAARELLVWTTDPEVQRALATRGWDGALPRTDGDFLALSEFAYAAKNGRGLRRTVDHTVDLAADGSARVTTRVTIANTAPAGPLNIDSQSYITIYGPAGGTLATSADKPDATEPDLAGHPAAGWLRAAKPGATTVIDLGWTVPQLLVTEGRDRRYQLLVVPTPGHTGDVLHLTVHLPPGWAWRDRKPDGTYSLDNSLSVSGVLAPP